MEIKTSMATCPNGHHYDAAKHASCPYCGPAGSYNATEQPGGGSPAAFSPTEIPGGPSSPSFSPTVPPAPAGGRINPFSVETTIGGQAPGQTDPVVGWLVCVEGSNRGADYRIHSGYNYIGRETGDICIRGDDQISRQSHAMIAFDSSELTYFFGPASGRNLIKVNGKTVLNAVEIKNYDRISIGATQLVFVALCGPQFSWDEGQAAHE